MGVGLPGQRDTVLGDVCHYRFVWRTWQLERLCGLGSRRVGTLCVVEQGEGGTGKKEKVMRGGKLDDTEMSSSRNNTV